VPQAQEGEESESQKRREAFKEEAMMDVLAQR
jgi:hypothetical protein